MMTPFRLALVYLFTTALLALSFVVGSPTPSTPSAMSHGGYRAVFNTLAPAACGTPAQITQKDFGWSVTLLSAKYQKATTPTLCDTKWPWTIMQCMPTSQVLATLGWPADLLQPQYLTQITCVPARRQQPTPTTGDGCPIDGLIPFMPSSVNMCLLFSKAINGLIVAPIQSATNSAFGQAGGFVWQTPAIYQANASGGLVSIWSLMLLLVDGCIALAVAWAGMRLILGQQSWMRYADAVEILPRIIFATLAAHFSLHFIQIVIEGNNAFCHVFAGDHQLIGLLTIQNAQGFTQFLQIFFGVMLIALIITAITRLALLSILMVLSPWLLFALALPETEEIGRMGITAIIALTFMQALQLAVLTIGGRLLATVALGTGPNTVIVNLLSGIAVLFVMLSIPRWIISFVFRGSQGRLNGGVLVTAATGAASWFVGRTL